MPRDSQQDLRQQAEERVEQRFAQQREALFAQHREQRERDRRAQEQAIGRVAQEQTRLAEQKRQGLEAHERKWDGMRDRIAYKPEPAPQFGWTPQRNIEREYRLAAVIDRGSISWLLLPIAPHTPLRYASSRSGISTYVARRCSTYMGDKCGLSVGSA